MARNSVTAFLGGEVRWCYSPEKYILSILGGYPNMLALNILSFCNITLFGLTRSDYILSRTILVNVTCLK